MARPPSGFVVAVVDNDERTLQVVASRLESANYDVRPFPSGTALLASGCLPEIDCLISDIDMTGMDALALLARIHAARPALPTILITDVTGRLEELPSLDAVYPGVFTKPLQPEEILTAVRDVLRKSHE